MKSILKLLRYWKSLAFIILITLIVDFSALVANKPALQSNQAQQARVQAKALINNLSSTSSTIELNIKPDELKSIAATMSHVFDNTQLALGYSQLSVQGASSTEVDLKLTKLYLNIYCEISLDAQDPNRLSKLDFCKIGDLPIPGFLVQGLMHSALYLIFDGEVASTINSIISNISVKNQTLVVNAKKSVDFKKRVNDSLSDAKTVAKLAMSSTIVDTDIIQIYVDDLALQSKHQDMSVYLRRSMQLASLRSIDNDPITENKAALWAWSMTMSSARFATLANIKNAPNIMHVTLRGRRDLALHFLISAMITQFGNSEFSYNIGELKEVLDSGKGGTGFSFADLLADKAGIAMATALTASNESALRAQQQLMKLTSQDVFFPYIHDVPEELSESDMRLLFGNITSLEYKEYLSTLEARISALPLYKNTNIDETKTVKTHFNPRNGRWITVDTHTHSKYSDGFFTIDKVAENAFLNGCDAIAITDHGDKELSGVLSIDYFKDIQKAENKYIGLTVIPGFEWNPPPFNGREHATVLLPKSSDMIIQYQEFRTRFDHYEEVNAKFLSINSALNWLNTVAQNSPVSPVVIYNHPSRKDNDSRENLHDMMLWQNLSPTVIGLSGAPGHQRHRGDKNGAYRDKLRTTNGLDPVSLVGGVWDQLLQKGFRTLGARASSDFHNLQLSHWPCKFSSTHVFAQSNRHNDVLSGLKNGRTWAQLGQFVSQLEFSIVVNNTRFYAGDSLLVNDPANINVNIDLVLNNEDWQGFDTSLDALSLIVVSANKVTEIDLYKYMKIKNKTVNVNFKMPMPSNTRAIRLIGRSIQPEAHDFQVFTNPIFIERK